MNKHRLQQVFVLALLAGALIPPFVCAEGNVWGSQSQGSYVPQGYSPQTGMGTGMGANMGMTYPHVPAYAQGYAQAYPPQVMTPPSVQPAWPVSPEHPAWPGGYPGLMPATPPAMTTGLPWPMR